MGGGGHVVAMFVSLHKGTTVVLVVMLVVLLAVGLVLVLLVC